MGTALTTRQLQQKNRLAKVFQYIEEKFLEKIQIADLAKLVFLSEVQFRSIFKQVTNLSPALYIQRKRLSVTAEMLMNTDKPVMNIIEETGSHNSALFFRSFKK